MSFLLTSFEMLAGAQSGALGGTPFDPASLYAKYGATGIYVRDFDPARLVNGTSRLFTTAGGSTPVAAATDPIGLLLDESQGAALGSELAANGGMDSDTAWGKGTGWSIAGGVATKTAGTQSNLDQAGILTIGRLYRIVFTVTVTAGALAAYAGIAGSADPVSASGTFTRYAIATGDTTFYIQGNAAFAGTVDDVSVREVLGNHLHQPTAAARGTLQQAGAAKVWRGDGVDDNLLATIAAGGYPATMIIAGTFSATQDYLFGMQDPSSGGRFYGIITGGSRVGGGVGNTNTSVIYDTAGLFPNPIGTPAVLALRAHSTLVTLWWRPVGGPPTKVYEAAPVSPPGTITPFRFGALNNSSGTTTQPLAGDIHGWIFIRANVSDADVEATMNNLAPA